MIPKFILEKDGMRGAKEKGFVNQYVSCEWGIYSAAEQLFPFKKNPASWY
jgi:hypothetical protein